MFRPPTRFLPVKSRNEGYLLTKLQERRFFHLHKTTGKSSSICKQKKVKAVKSKIYLVKKQEKQGLTNHLSLPVQIDNSSVIFYHLKPILIGGTGGGGPGFPIGKI